MNAKNESYINPIVSVHELGNENIFRLQHYRMDSYLLLQGLCLYRQFWCPFDFNSEAIFKQDKFSSHSYLSFPAQGALSLDIGRFLSGYGIGIFAYVVCGYTEFLRLPSELIVHNVICNT